MRARKGGRVLGGAGETYDEAPGGEPRGVPRVPPEPPRPAAMPAITSRLRPRFRLRRRSPRTGLTVVLLGIATGLVGILAYQAHSAARSHQATAEQTMRDYAAFANWEFTRHTRAELLTDLITMFVMQMTWIHPDDIDNTLPPVDLFAEYAEKRGGKLCGCLTGVHAYFRYNWHDRTLTTVGQSLSPAVRRWIQDTVTAYTRGIARSTELAPTPFGSVEASVNEARRRMVVWTNDAYAIVLGDPQGRESLLAFVVSRDTAQGEPIAAYGFESDPRPFAAGIVRGIIQREPLLPPSLVRGIPTDSILRVTVRDPAGHELFSTPARFRDEFASVDTLEERFGRFVVTVALRPDMAQTLVVGGLPHTRLPMLVGLFVLTAGLVIVALVQLRRQQEFMRLRSDFISGVSHELRTPLAHIRLFSELLLDSRLRGEEERQRSTRIIDQEARRLTYLIDNVLTFGRAERGAKPLTLVPTSLPDQLQQVVDEFFPLARAGGMKVDVVGAGPAVVEADEVALRQVLINILDNAVKYGPPGQTITVAYRRDETVARVWVDDQGPGIPAAERNRAFEPYYRLPRDASSAVGGSGIGLAVVRELVVMMGGQVGATAAPGGGARVWFTLRMHEETSEHRIAPLPLVEQST